jgi:hypothetical protein
MNCTSENNRVPHDARGTSVAAAAGGSEVTDKITGGWAAGVAEASARYAAGVDRRDGEIFRSAFWDDAVLTVPSLVDPSASPTVLRGHDEIGVVVERIARFGRTFHVLGQVFVEQCDDQEALAEVYCVAHHWSRAGAEADHMVLFVRYEDRYRRRGTEVRIASRRVRIDGSEGLQGPDEV